MSVIEASTDRALDALAEVSANKLGLQGLRDGGATPHRIRDFAAEELRFSVDPVQALALSEIIVALDSLRRDELERRCRAHSDQIASLHRVARTVNENTDRLSHVVTRELCTDLGYGKAMFSKVRGSIWSPVALAVNPSLTGDFGDLITAVDGRDISLRDAPREAELVRRRRPYAVDGVDTYRQTYRPLIDLSRPSGYLAAPVIVNARVVAIIHVDRQSDDVTESDIHIVETLAAMCAVATERARLFDTLRARKDKVFSEVERLRDELDRLTSVAASLSDPFGETLRAETGEPIRPQLPRRAEGLTSREREVLSMIARGASNAAIAQKLCISDGTVKTHVQRIFRKLGASTRAEVAALCAESNDTTGV
ncbi:GAF domain-containing protein [Rhodococcus sp. Eu-32]|nr:GAF domain-containing protein [Rhodococcus sp. Eu-32]